MQKVRVKYECSVILNQKRTEYNEGWHEVDEKHLKELRKLGAVASDTPHLEIETKNVGNTPILETKRRGRPPFVHATK